MQRAFLTTAFALILCASGVPAQDAVGTLQKIDADKGVLHIHAAGQDRTVKLARDVKVLGSDGKPLPDGIKSKELKEGAEVTVTRERGDGGPVITAIRLGRQRGDEAKEGGKPSVGLKPLTEM